MAIRCRCSIPNIGISGKRPVMLENLKKFAAKVEQIPPRIRVAEGATAEGIRIDSLGVVEIEILPPEVRHRSSGKFAKRRRNMSDIMVKSPKEVVLELYNAFNARDYDRQRACWAEDAVYHSIGDGFRREGVDAILEYTNSGLSKPFPDAKGIIHKVIVDGDQVVMDTTIEGTHTGAYVRKTDAGGIEEIPPTNRRICGHAVEWFTVKNGKIVEDRIMFDRMELMEQLGLVPGTGKGE